MAISNYDRHPSVEVRSGALYGRLVLASLRKTVAELAWAKEGQVEIVKAEPPDNAGLIGAAALFCSTGEQADKAKNGASHA